MSKTRLEAFSDGVIAILITIMVLSLDVPKGVGHSHFEDLGRQGSTFFTYGISFVVLGIYWNNHHHMFQATKRINGTIMWANMHLLFWLSLIPFVTDWMGERFGPLPVAAYGVVMISAAIAYYILSRVLLAVNGPDSPLARALGRDHKAIASLVLYAVAVGLALARPWLAVALYVVVALIWLVPDRRIERVLEAVRD